MADNSDRTPGAGEKIVTREISHAGDTARLAGGFLMGISGSEGSYTAEAVDGDAAYGLDVDVTRLPVTGTRTDQSIVNSGSTDLTAVDVSGYSHVFVTATSNADADLSAGAEFYRSPDGGTTWIEANCVDEALPEDTDFFLDMPPSTTDYRLVDVVGCTLFRLQAYATGAGGTPRVDFTITPVNGSRPLIQPVAIANTVDVSLDTSMYDTVGYGGPGQTLFPAGFVRDDSSPAALAEGDAGAARVSANRNQYVQIRDGDGNERGLKVDANGAIAVTADISLAAGANPIGSVVAGGGAAHDAAVSGNPLRAAGRAQSSDYTAVASGDTADLLATLLGKLVAMPYALPGATWQYAGVASGITDTSDDVAKAAPGAGSRNYVTHVDVVNGHASTDTEVVVKSGSTVIWRGFAKAGGGGASVDFPTPLRGGDNEAINVTNITTGAATRFNLTGFVAAE